MRGKAEHGWFDGRIWSLHPRCCPRDPRVPGQGGAPDDPGGGGPGRGAERPRGVRGHPEDEARAGRGGAPRGRVVPGLRVRGGRSGGVRGHGADHQTRGREQERRGMEESVRLHQVKNREGGEKKKQL